jgi:acyl-CoA synthetase (AMP-forming)/AMP-acid ligase II
MSTPPNPARSIRDWLARRPAGAGPERFLRGATVDVSLSRAIDDPRDAPRLAGRSVLVIARDQLDAALALIELDGTARRLIVATPDLPSEHLPALIADAGVDAIVSERHELVLPESQFRVQTEWVLLTSGTSGAPKMVVHTFASLTAAIGQSLAEDDDVVWGTFYDIRRYGGLQILLRAVLGRGSFVLSGAGEGVGDYLARLGSHGATHVSGTPSQWRRVLMSPNARAIAPRYIRLSGEIADQGILNALRSFYPRAAISHAFASTEAGVGFEVSDGLEGFPASMVDGAGDVLIRVDDGSLRIRSARNAVQYLGGEQAALAGADGFVDTGDMVERRGDRYYFLGRRSGLINVGGLKVYPEEVEAAINRHPAVRMSMVRSTRSALTGSLVAADVVLKADPAAAEDRGPLNFKREILQICHDSLAAYKIPATIRFVPSLELADAGKLARHA